MQLLYHGCCPSVKKDHGTMEKQEYLKIAENVGLLIDTPQDTYEEAKFTMLCMASNISDSFCQFVTILFSVMDSYRPLLLEMKGEGKQS